MLRLFLCIFGAIIFTQSAQAQTKEELIRLLARKNGLWGYVDEDGKSAIPFMYDRANPFDENGVARVEQDGQFMVISKLNEVLINGAFQQFQHLNDQYYKFQIKGKWGITVLGEQYKSEAIYNEPICLNDSLNIFKVEKKKGFGVLDSTLQVLIPFEFDALWRDSFFIVVKEGNKLGAFTQDGQRFLRTEWDSIVPIASKHIVAFKDKVPYLKALGSASHLQLEPGMLIPLNDEYFAVEQKGVVDIICLKDGKKKRLPCDYIGPLRGRNKSFVFSQNGWFGMYHFDKGVVLKPTDQFQEISVRDSMLRGRINGLFRFYTAEGERVGNSEFEQCLRFEDGIAFLRIGLDWGIVKRNGNLLLPVAYQSINILETEIRAHQQSGQFHLYEYQNGEITDSLKFGSLYRLQLRGFDNQVRSVNVPINTVNTTWFRKGGRWGLKDSTGKVLIKPLFEGIEKTSNSPYVLVYNPKAPNDKYPFNLRKGKVTGRMGLVNEATGQIMAPTFFSRVVMDDVESPTQDLIRVRSHAGYYGVVSKNNPRRRVFWKSAYIGPIQNGCAPVYLKGRMTLKKPHDDAIPIGNLGDLLTDMGLSPNFGVFDKSKHKYRTKVYLTAGSWNYIGSNGRLMFPAKIACELGPDTVRYSQIEHAFPFHNGIARIKASGKWALIDSTGNFVTGFDYDWIEPKVWNGSTHYITYVNADRHSCYTNEGKLLNQEALTKIEPFSNGLAWVQSGTQKGVMTSTGDVTLTNLRIKQYKPFGDGMAPVRVDGAWTFIDEDLVLNSGTLRFFKLGPYSNSRAVAKGSLRNSPKSMYGFLDPDGEWAVYPRYTRAFDFKNGAARVRTTKGSYILIDTTGKRIGKRQFTRVKDFNEFGLAPFWLGGRSGVIRIDGQTVVPPRGHRVFIQENAVFVWKTNKLVVYDQDGNKLNKHRRITKVYPMVNGLARVKRKGKTGYLNTKGEWLIEPRYWRATDFENGFALVGRVGQRCIINQQGDTVSKKVFRSKEGFSNGFFVLRSEDIPRTYTYINNYGENQFGVTFEYAKPFVMGKAVVKWGGKFGVIDTNGVYIVPPIYSSISGIQENYVVASQMFNYGLLDASGQQVLPATYEDIRFLPEGYIMVTKEDQPSYLTTGYQWLWR